MREIEFRGKTITGGWAYGDLLTDLTHLGTPISFICPQEYKKFVSNVRIKMPDAKFHTLYRNVPVIRVQQDTVTQFTGLYDSTGRKIFEGDILHPCLKDYRTIDIRGKYYGVVFHASGPYSAKYFLKVVPGEDSPEDVLCIEDCLFSDFECEFTPNICTVAGNIFDNDVALKLTQDELVGYLNQDVS